MLWWSVTLLLCANMCEPDGSANLTITNLFFADIMVEEGAFLSLRPLRYQIFIDIVVPGAVYFAPATTIISLLIIQ